MNNEETSRIVPDSISVAPVTDEDVIEELSLLDAIREEQRDFVRGGDRINSDEY